MHERSVSPAPRPRKFYASFEFFAVLLVKGVCFRQVLAPCVYLAIPVPQLRIIRLADHCAMKRGLEVAPLEYVIQ
ncbi:hypothetical protein D3C72_1973050 [compost metagenome]